MADCMKSLDRFVRALRRLPGVGPRQAERFSAYFLRAPQGETEEFINALLSVKQDIKLCQVCFSYCENDICEICQDPDRDHSVLCVVEDPQDIESIEKTGAFKGLYHVLHGAISPMLGIGPNDIRLKELIERLRGDVEEVIVATNSSVEGEATAVYISKLIKPTGIKVSRIASGVPVGGDLEYIDEITLLRALEGRTEL